MRHRIRWWTSSVLAIMVLIFTGPTTLSAQNSAPQRPDTSWHLFEVTKNSYLYAFADTIYGDGDKWIKLFDVNVAAGLLKKSDYHLRADGIPMVNLAVGQKLYLPRKGAETLRSVAAVPIPTPPTLEPAVVTQVEKAEDSRFIWYSLLAMLLTIAALILIWAIKRKLSNPVGSGPPMRAQGLTNDSAPDRFREMASSRTGTVGSPTYVSPEQIRLLSIHRGRGYGIMRVSYGDGRQETKHLNGEAVYEARVEFPGGRQETMYCLQACANDLVYAGNRYLADRLFRFEPEGASIPIPQPDMVATIGGVQVNIGNDDLTLTQNGRTITVDADGLRKGPDGGLILTKEGHNDVMFQNGRITGAPVRKRTTQPRTAVPSTE
ncbi:MAG: hypothetical protein JWN89_568 [Parcubacteria group bacterium]|nr:hypothetical protein [Parcubacteria group bacterium]